MRKPEVWLLVVVVCVGLMGRLWGRGSAPVATPTPATAYSMPSPSGSPVAVATPNPSLIHPLPSPASPVEVETPREPVHYDPPTQGFQPPGGPPPEVLANGWDGYDGNELAHAAGSSSGNYYVAAASKRNFYAAFESGGRWRLFRMQQGQRWTPLGPAVEGGGHWPAGAMLDRMGAGQIPDKAWKALRGCPAIRFFPVTE